MISLSLIPRSPRWITVSFPSTLHLHPILDVLVARVPRDWHSEVRLGLQEALVNAAKHGNKLDPGKSVSIRFSIVSDGYCWIISDQGQGFCPEQFSFSLEDGIPTGTIGVERDCGRGLFILNCIFDRVEWSADGTQLTLYKRTKRWFEGLNCFFYLTKLRSPLPFSAQVD